MASAILGDWPSFLMATRWSPNGMAGFVTLRPTGRSRKADRRGARGRCARPGRAPRHNAGIRASATTSLVYLSFAEKGEGRTNSTAVARGSLAEDNDSLAQRRVILAQKPKVRSNMHFGSPASCSIAREGTCMSGSASARTTGSASRRRTSIRISARSCASIRTDRCRRTIPLWIRRCVAGNLVFGHRNIQAAQSIRKRAS